MIGSNVNWYKGSLRPYESWISLGTKFCFLNRVGLNEFQSFVRQNWITEVPEFSRMLAKALGEPNNIARTLDCTPLLPPIDNLSHRNCGFLTLRYCPQCIGQGYHASFHQMAWFDRCLIHNADLIPDTDAMFHEKLGSVGPTIEEAAFDKLHILYFNQSTVSRRNLFRYEGNPSVQLRYTAVDAFINWNRAVKEAAPPAANPNAFFWDESTNMTKTGSRLEPSHSARLLSDRLHCIHAFIPCPSVVKSALRESRIVAQSGLALLHNLPEEMRADTPSFCAAMFNDLPLLYDLYRIDTVLSGEPAGWVKLVKSNFYRMLAGHEVCKQQFDIIENHAQWLRENVRDFKHLCPQSILSRRFAQTWALSESAHHFSKLHSPAWDQAQKEYLRLFKTRNLVKYKDASFDNADKELEEDAKADHTNLGKSSERKAIDGPWRDCKSHGPDHFRWALTDTMKSVFDKLMEAHIFASSWAFYEEAIEAMRSTPKVVEHSLLRPAFQLAVDRNGIGRLHTWSRTPTCFPNWSTLHQLDGDETHDIQVKAWIAHANHCISEKLETYLSNPMFHDFMSPGVSAE